MKAMKHMVLATAGSKGTWLLALRNFGFQSFKHEYDAETKDDVRA